MSLKDRLEGVLPPYLEAFRPFTSCSNKEVFIATWNLTDPVSMGPIINYLSLAKRVQLLLGYSKTFHQLNTLCKIARFYKYEQKWDVRVLPNCHLKVWVVGKKAWVGSCNFVPNTCYNLMVETSPLKLLKTLRVYWRQASSVSKSTNLLLVPPCMETGVAQVI